MFSDPCMGFLVRAENWRGKRCVSREMRYKPASMGVGKEREGAGFVSYSMGVNVPGTLHPAPGC